MRCYIFLAILGFAWAKVDYSGHQVYRVYPNEIQLQVLREAGKYFQLDFWSEATFPGDFVDFRVPPHQKMRIDLLLANNRLTYEVFIEDLEFDLLKQMNPRQEQKSLIDFDYGNYHTYEEIDIWIKEFTSANPALTTLMNMGYGKSFEGRNLQAIKISTGGSGKDAFVINCGIHAREWVTPATCIYTANQLITKWSESTEAHEKELMNNIDFYVIPLANPDGYAYTWTDDRMWRKTRSPGNMNNCRAEELCDGVDPNRNWNDHWDTPGGASDICCAADYRGPFPFSEIETKNQAEFVSSLSNVRAYIDIHAYSQLWMFPYGWTYDSPPDYNDLFKVGNDSVTAIWGVHGKTYETGTISQTIYPATGSTADYFYGVENIKCSFAAELRDKGRYGFTLPAEQIIPTAEETYAGLLAIGDNILEGYCN